MITLTNPKIIKYFNEHKVLDPEISFLLLIEILEKFGENIFEKMSSTINKQILDELNANSRTLATIQENMGKINIDIVNQLFVKMMDIKKEYIEDTKNIIASNINENISTIFEKNTIQLMDKTNIILNELIPKNNDSIFSNINEKITLFNLSLKTETDKILQTISNDESKLKESFHLFEKDVTALFVNFQSNLQQPLHMYITTSEDRINKNISNITEITKENMLIQNRLYSEMNDFLNKYRVSNHKGNFHETQLQQLLNSMFSNGEIIDTTGTKSSGDFLLKRPNKPNIMFENKDYFENVYNSEIAKFIYDSENIKTHGIFLSQQSGIAGKSNYQIDYHKGCILVYIHQVNYSKEKIQIAVDIIDNLSSKIEEFTEGEDININKDILEEINNEYQDFAIKKDTLIGITKDFTKKSLQQLEDMKFPSLEKYLSTHFATALRTNKLNNQYMCDICNLYICSTKKSLSAHQRGCKNKETSSIKINTNV
jgi:hypothetical protein